MALVAVGLLWHFRYGLGFRAIRVVDPVVRRWAAREVERLSDGVYHLEASRIRVDTDQRRIGVDTVLLSTDSPANRRRKEPLPTVTLRFTGCALDGVDLDRLSAGQGLAIGQAGCESVDITAVVPPRVSVDTSGSFLSLRQEIRLGRGVPSIRVDSIAFPSVSVALGIEGRTGRRTNLAFDRLMVSIDSFDYRNNMPVKDRRTLYSRNVSLHLEAFRGDREKSDRLEIAAINADLANGSFAMDGFAWEPLPGAFADSLGLSQLELDTLRLDGVDWRAFLTNGDAVLQRMLVKGFRVALDEVASGGAAAPSSDTLAPAERWVLERTLRTINRGVRLDQFIAEQVRVLQPIDGSDAVIEADSLSLGGVLFGFDPAQWDGSVPLGPVMLSAAGVNRNWRENHTGLDHLTLDLAAGSALVRGLSHGPMGSDADFVRRHRWRTDRVLIKVDSLALAGINAHAWVRFGAYRAAMVRATGLNLDVYSDKRLPARRGTSRHRYPQEWLRTSGVDLHVDSIRARGRVSYRERSATATRTGALRFENLDATVVNLGTDRSRMIGDSTIRLSASTRLMGTAPLSVRVDIPAFSPTFEMRWSGQLGRMNATDLNELVTGISDLRISSGQVERITFSAVTRNGTSRGNLVPRYRDLAVEAPGMARSGILQGLRRAVVKFAANQFVVRGDNHGEMFDTYQRSRRIEPTDGVIDHRWNPSETLIQHLWFSVRDALVTVMLR